MTQVPAPPPDSVVVARLAKSTGVDPDTYLSMALHAMACHITLNGSLTVPFHLVHNCDTCPMAAAKDKIITGPWPNKE